MKFIHGLIVSNELFHAIIMNFIRAEIGYENIVLVTIQIIPQNLFSKGLCLLSVSKNKKNLKSNTFSKQIFPKP